MFQEVQFTKEGENLCMRALCLHLKSEIVKILIPYIIKESFCSVPADGAHLNESQNQETFQLFENLCEIIERITPGEEDHLVTFLELVDSYSGDTGAKDNQQNLKIFRQFLCKAIETLLKFVLEKGIRVRSYHFYKFIRTYAKTSMSTGF